MFKSKRLASVLVLLVACIMLFSVLFIAMEADHDCCGEGCAICAQIQACEDLLRNLLSIAALVVAAWCLYALIRVFVDTECCPLYRHTLIVLKVKLSD